MITPVVKNKVIELEVFCLQVDVPQMRFWLSLDDDGGEKPGVTDRNVR